MPTRLSGHHQEGRVDPCHYRSLQDGSAKCECGKVIYQYFIEGKFWGRGTAEELTEMGCSLIDGRWVFPGKF